MANGVYHAGLGIELNLTEPDLGHPELPGLWEILHADDRPVPERQLQCLQCRTARPHCPEWMVLVEFAGGRFARHYTRGIADHSSNESDEHKAYKERIVHAAERGGFKVTAEDRSEDGTRRTDVLVRGGVDLAIGWEIQLSYASLESVRKRSRLARRDGITPLWGSVDATREFIDKVPWTLLPDMPWYRIKDDRDLLIRGGVRQLAFFRCDHTSPLPCPVRGRGRCGKLHGRWDTAHSVLLEGLVQGSATGEYVPIVLAVGKRTQRWWVRPDERDRYLDGGGGGLVVEDGLGKARKPRALPDVTPGPVDPECRYGQDTGFRSPPAKVRDDGSSVSTTATFPLPLPEPPPRRPVRRGLCNALADRNNPAVLCSQPAKFYPCGWRCDPHKPVPSRQITEQTPTSPPTGGHFRRGQ